MPTTIKVSSSTRDRVNAVGAATDQTADQVVAHALEEYERTLFWRAYGLAAEAASADISAAAEEGAERGLWDRTLRDGLSGA